MLNDHIIALAWSPDGMTLAAAEVSGPIALFETATGALRHRLSGHGFGTTALAWRPDGAVLCSAGQDGSVRWWEPQSGTEPVREHHTQGSILALSWRPDRRVIAGGRHDAAVQTWTFPEQNDLAMYGYLGKVRELAWDCSSAWLATGGATTVIVWD